MQKTKVIFEKGCPGRIGHKLPACDVGEKQLSSILPSQYLRGELNGIPEVSELDAIRHFTELSKKNHGVDGGFYPLGSCTMKYNPKINEDAASLAGFTGSHPLSGDGESQGNLRMMYELDRMLSEITGMDSFSLQPAAGAHGELAGLMIIKAYHEKKGAHGRTKILVPDTSHGTNPASAMMAGLEIVEIKSDQNGNVDLEDLRANTDDNVAGLMLTNPSTLGLFEVNIKTIADIIHNAGGLLYYDGANTNAIMGIVRPGDMGFDVIHLNLHKTFSTPHGGGGPGAGPIGVKAFLDEFLPKPVVLKKGDSYELSYDRPFSIGKMRSFYGNFGVLVRAYTYILTMGPDGIKEAAENAVLNANYLMHLMKDFMQMAYDRTCMHEFVATGSPQKEAGSSTLDMAKRMLDFGVHPPTIYFPLIVKEAMMFEPTETESKETLDQFAEIMRQILREAQENPEFLHKAPHSTEIGRLDDVKAARKPVLTWKE